MLRESKKVLEVETSEENTRKKIKRGLRGSKESVKKYIGQNNATY